MQLDSMTPAEVDDLVESFALAMQHSMNKACTTAAKQITLSADVIVADGLLTTAIDALGSMTSSWKKSVTTELLPFLSRVFTKAGKQVSSPLGVEISPMTLAVTLVADMEPILTGFSNDLWDTARASLANGSVDGETPVDLAARVEAVAEQKAAKAHVIAQTLIVGAVNGGEWSTLMAIAAKYDAISTKEWVATHDSHTRPTHWAADGQVVALDGKFVVGDALLDFPGDPFGEPSEIINCRCTTKYDAEILPANSSPQTSPDALSADSAVDTTEQISASAATNSNWKSSDHPRGKDGRFIKKGVGLPTSVFIGLTQLDGGDQFSHFPGGAQEIFVNETAEITPAQWSNLTNDQKLTIETAIGDAIDLSIPGAATAQMHLDELAGEDTSGDVFNDDDDVNLFDPNTPLPDSTPVTTGLTKKQAEQEIYDAYDVGEITDEQQDELLQKLDETSAPAAMKLLEKMKNEHATASEAQNNALNNPAPFAPVAPLTTGSPKPLKITHGFIHAKHETGATLARDQNGNEIVWNGTAYDIYDKNGDVVATNIKKSKMYALLNDYYKDSNWHEPGNEPVTVTHAAPLDAAPPANPIPHPVSFPGTSSVDDALDNAFGPTNTGLATPTDIFQNIANGNTDLATAQILNSPGAALAPPQTLSTPGVAQTLDMTGWVQVGGQAGSNKGALFEAPDGKRYYVKSLKSKEHAQNEVLAAALYRAAGMNAPEVRHVTTGAPPGWSNVIASPIVPNAKSNKKGLTTPGKFQEQAQQTYAVTAWLANFDAVGLTHDNMIESDGQVHLIDVGGSMGYRAQGQKKKPGDWNEDPTGALDGLMDPNVNPQAASVYGNMTYEQQRESAKALLGITDAQIDQLVADAGLPPSQAKILKARRDAILKKYGLDNNNNSTSNAPVATLAPVNEPTTPANEPLVPGGTITTSEIIDNADQFGIGEVMATGVDEDGDTWTVSHAPGGYVYMQVTDHVTGESSFVQQVTYPSFMGQSGNNGVNWTASDGSTSLLPGPSVAKKTAPAKSVAAPVIPSTPVPAPSAPTAVSVTDIPSAAQAEFYKHFKAENVSPAWSGAKIYKSMKAAQLKMASNPKFANLTDEQMLAILDEQHADIVGTGGPNVYSTKVKAWLATPAGQKVFAQLNPAIATTPTGPVPAKKIAAKKIIGTKKTATAANTSPVSVNDSSSGGPVGTTSSPLSDAAKAEVFGKFKASPHGKYLKDDPADIYWNAVQQGKLQGTTAGAILDAIDEEGAKKLGVANAGLFKKKVEAWISTPAGQAKAKAIKANTWSPAIPGAKKTTAKASGFAGGSSTSQPHAASTPLSQKVQDVSQTVPPFDNSKQKSDFPVISVTQAASLWTDMVAQSGQPFQPKQKASLRHYTTNQGFTNMNTYLRGQNGASAATQAHVTNAQAGMRPTTQDITIHRGNGWFTAGDGAKWTSYANIKALEGTDFHQESFFSASVGGQEAFSGKSISMEIEVPAGTPAAYVKAFSAYGGENEMLLAANLTYRVMEVTQKGHQVQVKLRVVPNTGA